ncbi:MAG: hypothetical protein KDE34_21570, partial [Anaerolineales bacterium]|nr:hypothetical protein [Anaerolineales bacterium]
MAHRRQDGTYGEIDTDWQPASGRDLLKIDVGDYTLRVGGQDALLFTNPRLLRYDLGGASLAVTPINGLYWDDGAGNTRMIGPATVSIGALLENRPDILRFPDAYGNGFHYDLVAEADRVFKRVRVPRRNRLGVWSPGEFVVLGSRIELDPNSSLWYWEPVRRQWQQWDGASEVTTFHKIQIRNSENQALYHFSKPFIQSNPTDRGIGPFNREIAAGQQWDAQEQQVVTYSWYRLWADRGNIRLDACFNPDVMPATTPFFLDPTLDLDLAAGLGAEDNTYSGTRPNTGKNYADTAFYSGGKVRFISNWDISATLDGSESITSAVLSLYLGAAAADWDSNIRLEDTPDSTFPTSGAECNTRFSNWHATTTNWDPGTTTGRQDTADFGAVFESVISGGGTVGEIAIDIDPIGTAFAVTTIYNGDGYGPTYEPDLTIEYEAGGGGAESEALAWAATAGVSFSPLALSPVSQLFGVNAAIAPTAAGQASVSLNYAATAGASPSPAAAATAGISLAVTADDAQSETAAGAAALALATALNNLFAANATAAAAITADLEVDITLAGTDTTGAVSRSLTLAQALDAAVAATASTAATQDYDAALNAAFAGAVAAQSSVTFALTLGQTV